MELPYLVRTPSHTQATPRHIHRPHLRDAIPTPSCPARQSATQVTWTAKRSSVVAEIVSTTLIQLKMLIGQVHYPCSESRTSHSPRRRRLLLPRRPTLSRLHSKPVHHTTVTLRSPPRPPRTQVQPADLLLVIRTFCLFQSGGFGILTRTGRKSDRIPTHPSSPPCEPRRPFSTVSARSTRLSYPASFSAVSALPSQRL